MLFGVKNFLKFIFPNFLYAFWCIKLFELISLNKKVFYRKILYKKFNDLRMHWYFKSLWVKGVLFEKQLQENISKTEQNASIIS